MIGQYFLNEKIGVMIGQYFLNEKITEAILAETKLFESVFCWSTGEEWRLAAESHGCECRNCSTVSILCGVSWLDDIVIADIFQVTCDR